MTDRIRNAINLIALVLLIASLVLNYKTMVRQQEMLEIQNHILQRMINTRRLLEEARRAIER